MAVSIMSQVAHVQNRNAADKDHLARPRPGAAWLERGLLILAVATGAVLRFQWIQGQILTDDEWHALNKLLTSGYFGIVSDFGRYDHSILLTLYYKFLSQTIGLSEFSMRLPSLLAGTLAVAWIPWLLRPFLGIRSSLILAWMLAWAPLQICYSRFARPYALTLLLVVTALVAFFDWLSRRGRRRMAVFLGAWTLAGAMHLPALLSIPGPFLFGLVESRSNPRSDRRTTGELLRAGAALTLSLGLVLGLPVLHSLGSVTNRLGMDRANTATLEGLGELFFGVTSPWLLVVPAMLAAWGGHRLVRREPRLMAYALFAIATQIGGLIWLRPQRLDAPITLARYCLWMQPLLLAAVAVGATRLELALPPARRFPWVSLPLLAGLVLSGPLGNIYQWPNNWTGHPALLDFHRPLRNLPSPSPFYDRLSTHPPGSLLILEAPWYFHHNAYIFYQRKHRQRMMIGFVDRNPSTVRAGEVPRTGAGVHLRNAVHVADLEGIRRRGIDLLIFHKRIAEEMADPRIPPIPVEDWVDRYRETCGSPEFEDSRIAVFEIRRCVNELK